MLIKGTVGWHLLGFPKCPWPNNNNNGKISIKMQNELKIKQVFNQEFVEFANFGHNSPDPIDWFDGDGDQGA